MNESFRVDSFLDIWSWKPLIYMDLSLCQDIYFPLVSSNNNAEICSLAWKFTIYILLNLKAFSILWWMSLIGDIPPIPAIIHENNKRSFWMMEGFLCRSQNYIALRS